MGKYSLLGAVRAVAQTIRYEVSITIILLSSMMFIMYDVSQKKQLRVGRWLAIIVFLAEYIAIIFISMLTSILFLITSYTEIIIFTGFIGFFYIWARGTLPRFRYDQLIYLA